MPNIKEQPEYLNALPDEISGDKTILLDKITTTSIEIKPDSKITIIAFITEGWAAPQELTFNFTGENSILNFIVLNIGTKNDTFPFTTTSIHHAPRNNAYYHISSVLFDQSSIDYLGNLVIKKPAQQTDCYLSHKTLILSPKAKVNTKPCLEIEADDVKAGHAATVGNIDEEALFYLKSRGLNEHQSKKLIVQGFLEKDLKEIKSSELKTAIIKNITHLLQN
ncbi:hypothetical protein CVV38_00755 [Candidatus Peregrinibacteria bacterium HGW-Peregrinibacteria-1]|jgi:Fe-S cluster assembly protein SufD|nr:MAG: hypothetical protein CVV38_00755 [Candidatus Peregrinibacteria bacterium HGW-Peregrinibacteria-1]